MLWEPSGVARPDVIWALFDCGFVALVTVDEGPRKGGR